MASEEITSFSNLTEAAQQIKELHSRLLVAEATHDTVVEALQDTIKELRAEIQCYRHQNEDLKSLLQMKAVK